MEATIINGSWKGHLGRGLAPRELQFLLWIAQGFTSKEIAREAGIEAGTVKKRLTNAMFKLGVTKRTALVAEAMKRQIITPVCFVLAARGLRNAQGQSARGIKPWLSDTVTGLLIAAPVYWMFTQFLAINLPGLTQSGWL